MAILANKEVVSVPSWMGIYGDSQLWVNGSVKYRDNIALVYHLTVWGSMITFLSGFFTSARSRVGRSAMETNFVQKIFIIFVGCLMFVYATYGIGSEDFLVDVEVKRRTHALYLNTGHGVFLVQCGALIATYYIGLMSKMLLIIVVKRK